MNTEIVVDLDYDKTVAESYSPRGIEQSTTFYAHEVLVRDSHKHKLAQRAGIVLREREIKI